MSLCPPALLLALGVLLHPKVSPAGLGCCSLWVHTHDGVSVPCPPRQSPCATCTRGDRTCTRMSWSWGGTLPPRSRPSPWVSPRASQPPQSCDSPPRAIAASPRLRGPLLSILGCPPGSGRCSAQSHQDVTLSPIPKVWGTVAGGTHSPCATPPRSPAAPRMSPQGVSCCTWHRGDKLGGSSPPPHRGCGDCGGTRSPRGLFPRSFSRSRFGVVIKRNPKVSPCCGSCRPPPCVSPPRPIRDAGLV